MVALATADLHGELPDVPGCDLLIIAGDVCPVTDHSLSRQIQWLEGQFSDWLRSLSAARVLGIAGNHDFALQSHPALAHALPWTYLQDSGCTVGGVSFWGVPWVPNLPLWAFHAGPERLADAYRQVPDGTDVVISHGPPRGLCDRTEKGRDVGAVQAVAMLGRVEPSVYVCGHIHEAFGSAQSGRTEVLNVSYVDERYQPRHVVVGVGVGVGGVGGGHLCSL